MPYASLLQGSLLQGLISALCLPVAQLTAARPLQGLISAYASLLQGLPLQGLISALCLPVAAARPHQCPCLPVAKLTAARPPWTLYGLVWSVFYTPTVSLRQPTLTPIQRRRKLFCIGQADKSDREEEGGYVHLRLQIFS